MPDAATVVEPEEPESLLLSAAQKPRAPPTPPATSAATTTAATRPPAPRLRGASGACGWAGAPHTGPPPCAPWAYDGTAGGGGGQPASAADCGAAGGAYCGAAGGTGAMGVVAGSWAGEAAWC